MENFPNLAKETDFQEVQEAPQSASQISCGLSEKSPPLTVSS